LETTFVLPILLFVRSRVSWIDDDRRSICLANPDLKNLRLNYELGR
jgi:hypothetical protein